MNKSLIFTDAELAALSKRLIGSRKDPTGIYSARVKAKIKEILAFARIEELKGLV